MYESDDDSYDAIDAYHLDIMADQPSRGYSHGDLAGKLRSRLKCDNISIYQDYLSMYEDALSTATLALSILKEMNPQFVNAYAKTNTDFDIKVWQADEYEPDSCVRVYREVLLEETTGDIISDFGDIEYTKYSDGSRVISRAREMYFTDEMKTHLQKYGFVAVILPEVDRGKMNSQLLVNEFPDHEERIVYGAFPNYVLAKNGYGSTDEIRKGLRVYIEELMAAGGDVISNFVIDEINYYYGIDDSELCEKYGYVNSSKTQVCVWKKVKKKTRKSKTKLTQT